MGACGTADPDPIAEASEAVAGASCSDPVFTVSPAPADPSHVLLHATSTCAGAPAQYEFVARAPGAAAWVVLRPYGTVTGFGWSTAGQPLGRHEVVVRVRPQGSTATYDAYASGSVFVGEVCTAARLTASVEEPAITASATATCAGGRTPEYRFLARAPGAATYTEFRSFDAAGVATLPWSAAGRYELLVYVRAAGNASTWEAYATAGALAGAVCTGATVRVLNVSNGWVNLEAAATCPGAVTPPEFRFLVRRAGRALFEEVRPYDSTPWSSFYADPGRHELQVYVRAGGNASAYEAVGTAAVLVGRTCGQVALTTTALGPGLSQLGGAATCTEGGVPEYRFLVKPPGAPAFEEVRGYDRDAGVVHGDPLGRQGRFEYQVQARAWGNPSAWESTATAAVLSGRSCSAATLAVSPRATEQIADLRAGATCQLGGVPEYRFLARAPGAAAFAEIRPWGPAAELAFPWSAAGRWELEVQARAAGNASASEASARAPAFLGPVCSSAALTVRQLGGWLELAASAACTGGGIPEYRFLARVPGASTFSEIASWGPWSEHGLTVYLPGRHELQVQVRRAGNATPYEALATAVVLTEPSCTSAALRAVPDGQGAVLLSATGTVCSGGYLAAEHRYLVRLPGSTTWEEVAPWSESWIATHHVPPAVRGRVEYRLLTRARWNASDFESLVTASALVGPSCASVVLDAASTGPESARVTATAACAFASPEYRFLVRRPGAAAFAELRGWGAEPFVDLLAGPAELGRWDVQVQARAAGNASDWEATATRVVLLGPSCAAVTLAGTFDGASAVELLASASCTPAIAPEYRFFVRPPGASSFMSLGDFGPEARLSVPVVASRAGRYELLVYARAAGNRSDAESSARALVAVGPSCTSVALATQAEPDFTVLTAAATCSGGAWPEYRWLVLRPGATVHEQLRGWSWDPGLTLQSWPTGAGRYGVVVQARAAGNASELESTASASVLVGPTCSSATLSATPDGMAAIDLVAGATCTYPAPEFRLLARAPGASAFTEVRAYSPEVALRFPVPPGASGRWEFQVEARLQGNASASEATARTSALSGPACRSASLTAAVSPPGGMQVQLAAAAACEPAMAEYRFLVRRPGETAFSELRRYEPEAALSYAAPPSAAGRYDFQLQARAAGNASDWEATAATTALLGPSCGTAFLDVTSDGFDGVQLGARTLCAWPAEFQLLVRRPGAAAFEVLRGWSPEATAAFRAPPDRAGRHEFKVNVRAQGNASDAEASATVSRLLGPSCSQLALERQAGQPGLLEFRAAATCTFQNPTYRFLAKGPGETAFREVQGWGWDSFLHLPAPEAGRWEIRAYARADGNVSDHEAAASAVVHVGPSCTAATLAVNGDGWGFAELTAAASCVEGGAPEYRFLVRRPGQAAFSELRGWDAEPIAALHREPWDTAGRYELQVDTRSAGNRSEVEGTARAVVFLGEHCPLVSLAASPRPYGTDAGLHAEARCVWAEPEYRFLVRRPGTTAFVELRGWGESPDLAFDAYPLNGRYDFTVQARARGNASDQEASATATARLGFDVCTSATLSATPAGGLAVDLLAAASCQGATLYRFLARAPGASAFAELAPWQVDPWARFEAPAPGRYEFRVEARGLYNPPDWEASAQTYAGAGFVCGSPTLTTTVHPDPAVALQASAACTGDGWGGPAYRFHVRPPGATAFVPVGEWGGESALYWPDPAVPGRYEFRVDVTGEYYRPVPDASTLGAAHVGTACTAATLTATPDGAGGASLSASATCGGAPAEYRFLARRPAAAAFTELRGWGADASHLAPLDPLATGLHELQVDVRAAGNASAWEATARATARVGATCTAATLSGVASGSTVSLSAGATCGGAAPEYRFFVRPPGATASTELRPFGPVEALQFEAPWGFEGTVPGAYTFTVYARAAGNTSTYEATATRLVLVGRSCRAVTLTATPDDRGYVILDAAGTCTDGATPEYQFLARPTGTATFTALGQLGTAARHWWEVPPGATGSYDFLVYARAAGNASAYEAAAVVTRAVP